MFQSTQSRWHATTQRARAAHSAFFYGVKSTKIYCRPTCPARLARRANVVFYDTADQAIRDGFRPCKRCRPEDSNFAGDKEEVVSRVIALLRTKKDEITMKGGLKELAHEVGVTPSYLCRVFKKTMGITVGQYMMEFEQEPGHSSDDGSSVQTTTPEASYALGPMESYSVGQLLGSTSCLPGDGVIDTGRWDSMEDIERMLDLEFNLDDWFWGQDFLHGTGTATGTGNWSGDCIPGWPLPGDPHQTQ